MYSESELLMLSGLQHFIFCERQWALIHIEQQWTENTHTASGKIFHDKVHSTQSEQRGNIRIARSLRLVSLELGLVGQADVVEFYRCTGNETGVSLAGKSGLWRPFPVEYKLGKPKKDSSDEVQLCAQAICLEEMLNLDITDGALFYGKQRRRKNIRFDDELRELTKSTAQKIHQKFTNGITPASNFLPKCASCSLLNLCMPKNTGQNSSASQYIRNTLEDFT